jgi:TPP-dependent pyruvate/acetoin dehydrogenase alpha subunit
MTTRKTKPGSAPAAQPGDGSFSLISNEKLLELYTAMLKCRMIEERVRLLSGEGPRADFNCVGHHASAAGIVAGLLSGDLLSASGGDLATRFLKGVSLPEIFSTLFHTHRNGSDPISTQDVQANVLPSSPSLDGRLEAAERAAQLNKRTRNRKVVALFCTREEASNAAWQKSLRSAAAARLPLIFVCRGRDESDNPAQRALDLGLPDVTVDGDDVVAIYRVASEALAHARRGNGPTLIECMPWTVRGAKRSRSSRAGNAVRNMEKYLAAKGLITRKLKAGVISQFARELDEAVVKARGSARKAAPGGPSNRLSIR